MNFRIINADETNANQDRLFSKKTKHLKDCRFPFTKRTNGGGDQLHVTLNAGMYFPAYTPNQETEADITYPHPPLQVRPSTRPCSSRGVIFLSIICSLTRDAQHENSFGAKCIIPHR